MGSSHPPAALARPERADVPAEPPIRAGQPPKRLGLRDPDRAEARIFGARLLTALAGVVGVSTYALGRGDDRDGARLLAGTRPLCVAEAILLLPLVLAVLLVVELLSERLGRVHATIDRDHPVAAKCRKGQFLLSEIRGLFAPEHR